MNEGEELLYLKEKIDAGADYIVTQLFYDVDAFLIWLQRVRDEGSLVKTTACQRELTRHRYQGTSHCWYITYPELCVLSPSH